jgi:hypothetical protein
MNGMVVRNYYGGNNGMNTVQCVWLKELCLQDNYLKREDCDKRC